jgi:transcriptional regulator GlxA family with amidase domain
LLPQFGAITDPGRVVRDGNFITGGGVTAGIDMALKVMAEIAGIDYAGVGECVARTSCAQPDLQLPKRASIRCN